MSTEPELEFISLGLRYLVGHNTLSSAVQILKAKSQIHKVLMIILQKSFPVCPTFPIFHGRLDWQGMHPCSECVRKPLYPSAWRSTMQEEPFLCAQPRKQWLHQLLGHKELLVFGTLPRFFGTRLQRSMRGSANTSLHVGKKGNDEPGRNCLETEVSSKATEQAEVLTGAGMDPELLQSCVYQGADGCHPHTRDKQGKASPEPFALPAEQTKLYLLRTGEY